MLSGGGASLFVGLPSMYSGDGSDGVDGESCCWWAAKWSRSICLVSCVLDSSILISTRPSSIYTDQFKFANECVVISNLSHEFVC